MTCNRAQETDLLAFLADPRREELREFRAHYPLCADCSAEVRAWSEVDSLLRDASADHPAPAELLRFESEPGSLDGRRRAQLTAHLEGCSSCRDEVGALRSFVAAQSKVSAEPVVKDSGPSLLARLRAGLWSPAFAYGLLVLLCVPLLSDYWSQGPTASFERLDDAAPPAPEASRADSERVATPAPAADRKISANADSRSKPLTQTAPSEEPPLRKKAEAAPPPEMGELREKEGLADRPQEFAARMRRSEGQKSSGPLAMEADTASTESAFQSAAPAKARVSPVAVDREGDHYRIRIRSELGLQPEEQVELRLIQADGARALVERVRAKDGVFEIRVPASWLIPGAHQLELRDARGERVLATYSVSTP